MNNLTTSEALELHKNNNLYLIGHWATDFGRIYCDVIFAGTLASAKERAIEFMNLEHFRNVQNIFEVTQEEVDEKLRGGDVFNQVDIID